MISSYIIGEPKMLTTFKEACAIALLLLTVYWVLVVFGAQHG